MTQQCVQDAGGVGTAAGAGVVLHVGDDDRLDAVARQGHGGLHGFVGRVDLAAEIGLGVEHGARHGVGGGVGVGLGVAVCPYRGGAFRSEEHTSELQSLMRISYAVFCLKKKKKQT